MSPRTIPFGGYELLEKVASGGMAEIWRARFVATGEIVAVKRILPAIAADHSFINMFLNEARIAVQLTHPGVVRIRDLGEVGESYFIAMEYLGGQSLRAILDRAHRRGEGFRLPVSVACLVVLEVSEALDYVHHKKGADGRALGIVHRDVSPENVLVSWGGEVKLVDFGIAKASTAVERTKAGLIKGKLAYLSPEQSRGLPIDGRSDVFSLGAVFHELLTGERLFLAENEYGTVMAVRERPVRPPSQLVDRIPADLDAIVLRALERDLERRFQTAGEMAGALGRFVMKQTQFGRDELSSWLRTAFPDEWERERRAAATFGGSPPVPARLPGALGERAPGAEIERTELAVRAPFPASLAAGALPRAKRTRSFKTLIIPILEGTGVYRRAETRRPQRHPPPAGDWPTAARPSSPAAPDPAPLPSAPVAPPSRSPLPWLLSLLALALGVIALLAPKLLRRPERGYLVVNASPANAIVLIDGAPHAGMSPVVVELPAGPHQVHVEAAGFSPDDRAVEIAAGGQVTVEVSLAVAR